MTFTHEIARVAATALVIVGVATSAHATAFKADFNGDGYEDLAVGTPDEDIGAIEDAGMVTVDYGGPGGIRTGRPSQDWHQDALGVREVAEAHDRFGAAIAVGDFDGDGFDDLAVGVPGEDQPNRRDTGIIHVLFGSVVGLSSVGDQLLDIGVIRGGGSLAQRFLGNGGVLVSGDFDGDGYDDLATGMPNYDLGATWDVGAVVVHFGGFDGLERSNPCDCVFFGEFSDWIPGEAGRLAQFGGALAVGDFDSDGLKDLAVGVPSKDVAPDGEDITDQGLVHMLRGNIDQSFGYITTARDGVPEEGDFYGSVLAAGDIDGNGYDDLLVGTPYEDVGGAVDAGQVHIYRRGPLVAGAKRGARIQQGSAGVPGRPESYDNFGTALVVADLTGDGIDDVAVGVSGEGIEHSFRTDDHLVGVVHFLVGQPLGLISQRFAWDQDRLGGSNESYDRFGAALSHGDHNDDGVADLVVAVPAEDLNGSVLAGTDTIARVGQVWIIPGRSGGLWMDGTQRYLFQAGQERADPGEALTEEDDRYGTALP